MDENLDNIEDIFYSALNDNEETPSPNVWEAVDKQLDKDNIISIKRKYANLKKAVALLLLLVLSFTLYEVGSFYKNKVFVKSNIKNPSEQSKSGDLTDKAPNERQKTNFLIITDTTTGGDNNKETVIPNNSTGDHIAQGSLEKSGPLDRYNSQKNVKENSGNEDLTIHQREKRNTNGTYRVKITNAVPVENNEVTEQNDYADDQPPPLQKQKDKLDQEVIIKPKDLIENKERSQTVVSTKVPDTSTIAKPVKKNERKLSRISITPFFSPDIAWYRLEDDKLGNQPDNANEIEREEKHEFSSTVGVLVDYKINKHWGLQSGLTLSNTSITVEPKTIYAQPDNGGNVKYRINTSSGYGYILPSFSGNPAIGDSLYAVTSIHSLQYIAIPFGVTYNVTKGKFEIKALAGVSTNILTRAKLETTVEKGFNNSVETVNNMEGLKKIYFSGLTGIGVDYKLTKKTAIAFLPVMRFALNSINKDAPVKSYPMTFGFTVGLKIGL